MKPHYALISLLLAAPAFAADETDDPSFEITEMRVLGNTVLESRDIEAAVYPHLGPDRTLKDVEAARDALTQAYREKGFGTVFVDIPEQNVEDGIVRLKVTQGRIDRVRISGARYFSNGRIREAIPALKQGETPNLPELQAELARVNQQSRDRSITPVLRAGRTPGTVDVELKVEDKLPVHATFEVNDRYTADTSRTRASVNLSYDNLFQRFHSLSLQYQTAPQEPSEAQVLAATYIMPMPSSGNMLAVYAVDTDSDVATVGTLSVLGKGRIYGTRYIVPVFNSAEYNDNFAFGVDFKDFKESVLLPDTPVQNTPISYLNWSVTYTGNARSERAVTGFNVGMAFGIRGVGNSSEEFWFKRSTGKPNKGDPSYFYLRAGAEREQALFAGMKLYGRLAGQYTAQTLISNEQFSIGGAESVRGYLEAAVLGDYGASGTLELRSPSLLTRLGNPDLDLVGLVFADAGVIGILEPLDNQMSHADLSSWGVGMRFRTSWGVLASLDWARPLVDARNTEAGDSRLHFQLRYGF